MGRSGVLQITRFAYRKGLGTCDAQLCMSHTLKILLESWPETRIVQIEFSAAFDMIKDQGMFYKLCYVGIGRSGCLYRHSFYQIDHSALWYNVVGANWVTLCQECRMAVLEARYYFSYTHRSFFTYCRRIIFSGYADYSTLMESILSQFLSNRPQHVMVECCRSKLGNVVSGVPHGSIGGPLLFLLYPSELFYILGNNLFGLCRLLHFNGCYAIPRS